MRWLWFGGVLWMLGCRPPFTEDQAQGKLLFQVRQADGNAVDAATLDVTLSVIDARLRGRWLADPYLLRKSANGEIELLTRALNKQEVSLFKAAVTSPGTFEFALLANARDHAELIQQAEAGVLPQFKGLTAAWFPVKISAQGQLAAGTDAATVISRELNVGGTWRTECLVVLPTAEQRITAKDLRGVTLASAVDGGFGINFQLTDRGGRLLSSLTTSALPSTDQFQRQLAVLINSEIHAAPAILAVVRDSGVIHGAYDVDELGWLTTSLNGGELPCRVTFEKLVVLREDHR